MADGGKLIIKIDGDDSDFKKVSKQLGKVGDVGFKAIKASALATTGAIAAIGTAAIKSYADYEQLVGGVDTLFKESSQKLQGYAAQAYKTAGLSANQYMETATSFSASLLQSLGGDTEKAAEYADMAICDMSDNANKMGTSMETLQTAYQGFAKGQYMLLDNLKLGYGGTKAEMERLIKDASKLDKSIDANDISFGNIVKSINAVQKEMGILGTTSKEASSTITGSLNSMKASWKNLMTGVADPSQDFDKLVKEFVDSVVVFGRNLAPRIKIVLNGAVDLFKTLGFEIVNAVRDMLPEALGAFGEVLSGILGFVQNNIRPIIATFYTLTTAFMSLKAVSAVSMVVSGVSTALGTLGTTATLTTKVMAGLNAVMAANPFGAVAAAIALVVSGLLLLNLTEKDNKTRTEELISASEENIKKLEEEAKAYEELSEAKRKQAEADLAQLAYVESLANELSVLADESGRVKDADSARVDFILSELNDALGTEYELVGNVISNYDTLTDSIFKAIEAQKAEVILAEEKEIWAEAVKKQSEAIKDQREALLNMAEAQTKLETAQKNYQESVASGNYHLEAEKAAVLEAEEAVNKASEAYQKASETVEQTTSDMERYETDYALVTQGKASEVIDSYMNMGKSVVDYSDIVATEQQKAGQRYAEAVLALANYRASHKGELTALEQETLAQLEKEAENAKKEADEVGVNIVDGTVEGIEGRKFNLKSTITKLFNSVPEWAKKLLGIHSPSRVFRDEVGKMITLGLAEGIEDNRTEVEKVMDEMNKSLLESEQKYLDESERLKNSRKEADKEYLESLKETAEKERKIYDALQEDIKNAQESVVKSFESLAEEAFDSIDEIEEAQSKLADKLKDFGELYTTETKKNYKGEYEVVKLADIEKQTQALQNYAQALLDVKARGDVPQEFFATLRDLSVEEGTKFAEALLKADDETFNDYIEDWKEKQAAADELAVLLYSDEANNAKAEIEKSFEKFDEDLDKQGEQNAEAWGKGFLAEVKQQIPEILAVINQAFGEIIGTPTYALESGNTVQHYTTYTERGPIVVEGRVELDGREVGRIVVDEGDAERRRRG